MNAKDSRLVLALRSLTDASLLMREVSAALAAAATVTLERRHGVRERDDALILPAGTSVAATIERADIDDSARRTYDDRQEATEEGAEGVAILVARRVLDRVVFARLPKGSGADYRMRELTADEGDDYERLECSGIGDSDEGTRARLRDKIAQLARVPDQPPGYAIVTNFVTMPVEIAIGIHSP